MRTPAAIRPTLNVTGLTTEEEIRFVIRSMKADTTPGLEGRALECIHTLDIRKLEWGFNGLLLLKEVPWSWAKG
ncbi:hypothetical protein E2C01_033162 [Portunus trituberculatus]|uniref:Uncharacterized protein n=1 Tax=Portunus trituberculatus TaxID=210409 RepID=A0A5B7F2A2_PORTR|nr:hypothetical protein [Portunus trituberculatus]